MSAARPILLVLALAAAAAADVSYIDSSITVLGGRPVLADFHDVDGDGRNELVVVVYMPQTGRRELRIHRERADGGIDIEPAQVVPVLEDIVAFSFADVRDEPGPELLFLTRSGAWSYSLAKDGYRGNIEKLVETPLVYDVADPQTLPMWNYVLPSEGGDELLLPERTGIAIWGPEVAEEGARRWVERTRLDHAEAAEMFDPDIQTQVRIGGRNIQINLDPAGSDVLLPDPDSTILPALLSVDLGNRAPALLDVDGNGQPDLLLLRKRALAIHLADANGGIPAEPTRIESIPIGPDPDAKRDYLTGDFDGDGDTDLLIQYEGERSGFADVSRDYFLHVYRNDGRRLIGDDPDQVLRFEATKIRAQLGDVDGDGVTDLVATKSEAPDLLSLTSPAGLEFKRSTLVFLGNKKDRRPFSAKPDLRHEDVFDETTASDALVRRWITLDCSGDDIADLVDVDLNGVVSIRRLQLESSFFGGDSWELETSPWRRFETRATMRSFAVVDGNGDGLGDVISIRGDRLTLLLSRRGGR